MASAATVSAADRQRLAARVATRLVRSSLIEGPRSGLELGEAFAVYVLRSVAIAGSGRLRRLGPRPRKAPYLHFQIRRDGAAVLAAHAQIDQGDWEVGNLFGAALAPKVGAAIAWVDRHQREEGEARLLLVPECSVVAFWIKQAKRDRIVLVSGSSNCGSMRLEKSYTVHAFLKALFGDYSAIRPAKPKRHGKAPSRTGARQAR